MAGVRQRRSAVKTFIAFEIFRVASGWTATLHWSRNIQVYGLYTLRVDTASSVCIFWFGNKGSPFAGYFADVILLSELRRSDLGAWVSVFVNVHC
jgi:hypothetical protein